MPSDALQTIQSHAAVARVREALRLAGLADDITVMPEATHTALMDEDLLHYLSIWPAVGHPNTMFRIAPGDLVHVTGAQVADIALRRSP